MPAGLDPTVSLASVLSMTYHTCIPRTPARLLATAHSSLNQNNRHTIPSSTGRRTGVVVVRRGTFPRDFLLPTLIDGSSPADQREKGVHISVRDTTLILRNLPHLTREGR